MIKRYLNNIASLYIDGFKGMKLGKKLWLIIAIKLIIMFGILKIFLFNETLNTKFETNEEKSDFVINSLTKE
ncbi:MULTISPECIES: DUF4492 domain-containing protein [Campylobacter]|uniref:DUF4492 domain-containing protein n=1 Tax=Campylobacter TaxID=194 RepID=UPI00027A3477|nr:MULTISPECIES: DUF4492 domain-containing protein [Campylobacter]EJP76138.1 hypothetical protein HMPREF1139_1942 [Campylobacter sp. FOBRC14]MBN7287936.1 DUF4492 domain-containing protein [Campylobacter curvus]MDU6827585.1 DUF4492 domain-containing protein [Campylobacter sp.]UEB50404.1 DUF4492 domain-containing protein [Campylobacter curvus]